MAAAKLFSSLNCLLYLFFKTLTLNVNLLFANEVAEGIAGLATIFARVLGGHIA